LNFINDYIFHLLDFIIKNWNFIKNQSICIFIIVEKWFKSSSNNYDQIYINEMYSTKHNNKINITKNNNNLVNYIINITTEFTYHLLLLLI